VPGKLNRFKRAPRACCAVATAGTRCWWSSSAPTTARCPQRRHRLIQDIGFAPFFAGGASNACLTETGGPLQLRGIDVADATAAFAQAMGTAW
jgi:hypothetical protein